MRLLGRRVATTGVSSLVSYRDDELARDHPLRVALGDLSTAAAVDRLPVRPLSREGVARLADGTRRRCRHRLAPHVRQSVLRQGAPRARGGGDPGHRARPGSRTAGAARPAGDCRGRGDRDRAAVARRCAPPRGVRRGGRLRRRVPRERRPPHRRQRRRVPPRAVARGRRGVALAGSAPCAASIRAAGPHRPPAGRRRSRADRTPCRGGGRRRGRARAMRRRPPSRQRASARIARRRPSTRGRSASRAISRPETEPSSSRADRARATSRTTRRRRSTSFGRRSGAGRSRALRSRRLGRSPSSRTTCGAAATSGRRSRPSRAQRSWRRATRAARARVRLPHGGSASLLRR